MWWSISFLEQSVYFYWQFLPYPLHQQSSKMYHTCTPKMSRPLLIKTPNLIHCCLAVTHPSWVYCYLVPYTPPSAKALQPLNWIYKTYLQWDHTSSQKPLYWTALIHTSLKPPPQCAEGIQALLQRSCWRHCGNHISGISWPVSAPPAYSVTTISWLAGMILLCVAAPLYYVPHFCLQKLLQGLDNNASRGTIAAYAILMVIAKLISSIIGVQRHAMWAIVRDTFSLWQGLIVQIVCEDWQIYEDICIVHSLQVSLSPTLHTFSAVLTISKILTKSNFATPLASDAITELAPSQPDVLNLITNDIETIVDLGDAVFCMMADLIETVVGCWFIWTLMGKCHWAIWSVKCPQELTILGFLALCGLCTVLISAPVAYLLAKGQYKCCEKAAGIHDTHNGLLQEMIQAISMIKLTASERFWYKRVQAVKDEQLKNVFWEKMLESMGIVI